MPSTEHELPSPAPAPAAVTRGTTAPAGTFRADAYQAEQRWTPRLWAFVEAFPMTASGKIRKVELPALFEGSVRRP